MMQQQAFPKIAFYTQHGLTLFELVTSLLIIACICSFAIPPLHTFLMRQERELLLDNLKTAIYYAQNEALKQGKTIILCGRSKTNTCDPNQWTNGFLVTDNEQAHIFAHFPSISFGTLKLDAMRSYLAFEANGTTNKTNGMFSYCPKHHDSTEAKTLIVNDAGRPYLNGNKNRRGEIILCL